MVKWPVLLVKAYLNAGSPLVKYTCGGKYMKTEEGDIDVGQHFNNFLAHPEDQPYLGVWVVHATGAV